MPTTRILEADHKLLQELGQRTGKQHQEIVHEALDMYRRNQLLAEMNVAYGRLRADPAAWAEEAEERTAWEGTIGDGVGDE